MHVLSKEFPQHIISMWQISRENIYRRKSDWGNLLAQLPSPLQKGNLDCLFLPLFFIFQGHLASRLSEKNNSLLLEIAEGVWVTNQRIHHIAGHRYLLDSKYLLKKKTPKLTQENNTIKIHKSLCCKDLILQTIHNQKHKNWDSILSREWFDPD